MEIWKEKEVQAFYAANYEIVDGPWSAYDSLVNQAMTILGSMDGLLSTSFQSKQQFLRFHASSLTSPQEQYDESLKDLALSWAPVNLHAKSDDDDWFEASTDCIFRQGTLCQSFSGLDAFMMNCDLRVRLALWPHGMYPRLSDWTDGVERILLQRITGKTHPSLRILPLTPNVLDGLSVFFQTEPERELWHDAGSRLIARLLSTHSLSVGLQQLGVAGQIQEYLPSINGAILRWPEPLVRDLDFTCGLLEKWGVTYHVEEHSPGYFSSDEWGQALFSAAHDYLACFDTLFRGDDVSNLETWHRLGVALQTFSQLVWFYEIDHYKQ